MKKTGEKVKVTQRARSVAAVVAFLGAACSGGDQPGAEAGATAGDVEQPAAGAAAVTQSENAGVGKAIRVSGGGPVIQILPGPFPFPDSAARVIRQRPESERGKLLALAKQGPYSNNVAPISGSFSFTAWDKGSARDSVSGTAEFKTQDGATWQLVLTGVQTKDVPFNPRFGGVVSPLHYHGSTNNHTPLIPTILSEVALWSFGELSRNGRLVDDSAMVHVMLLSRTRDENFRLACYSCEKNPVEELQLQIASREGRPKLETPGGVLFVNWQKSTSERPPRR